MKKKNAIWIVVILIAIVLLGVYLFGSGSDLQGRFGVFSGPGSGSDMLTLADSSPSGSRTVSVADTVMVFDLNSAIDSGESLRLRMKSDADFNLDTTDVVTAYLYLSSEKVAEAEVSFSSVYNASAKFELPSGLAVGTYSIQLNTAELLDEDAGTDDPLNLTLSYNIRTKLRGNTINY